MHVFCLNAPFSLTLDEVDILDLAYSNVREVRRIYIAS